MGIVCPLSQITCPLILLSGRYVEQLEQRVAKMETMLRKVSGPFHRW